MAEFLLPSAVNQGGRISPRGLGMPPLPLRDASRDPWEASEYPIGGIGTREKLYLHQMNALIGKKGGFSR